MSLDNDIGSTGTRRLAEGTDSKRYQPLPGDLVSVDCRGIAPKYDQHGTRLGTVITVGSDGDVEVKLPGWNHVLYLKPGWLELVRR